MAKPEVNNYGEQNLRQLLGLIMTVSIFYGE